MDSAPARDTTNSGTGLVSDGTVAQSSMIDGWWFKKGKILTVNQKRSFYRATLHINKYQGPVKSEWNCQVAPVGPTRSGNGSISDKAIEPQKVTKVEAFGDRNQFQYSNLDLPPKERTIRSTRPATQGSGRKWGRYVRQLGNWWLRICWLGWRWIALAVKWGGGVAGSRRGWWLAADMVAGSGYAGLDGAGLVVARGKAIVASGGVVLVLDGKRVGVIADHLRCDYEGRNEKSVARRSASGGETRFEALEKTRAANVTKE
ncbi:hypothetical protein BJ138DRAFT_1106597 [Hygrophoropsis aurantiaca]|uniref:Uncharacterized protein n=1 Tax=Hygrophoropsis aurantiaca TaxID=72124 RepID=A0ACB7ZVF2_9AGAM|nr:hypothetical protein BJ138DRAFT_1106597 [Hygrophoropsis aurantiaca]